VSIEPHEVPIGRFTDHWVAQTKGNSRARYSDQSGTDQSNRKRTSLQGQGKVEYVLEQRLSQAIYHLDTPLVWGSHGARFISQAEAEKIMRV
jgi:hypothetical protein